MSPLVSALVQSLGPLAFFFLMFLVYVAFFRGRGADTLYMGGRRAESRLIGDTLIGYWFWFIGPLERFFVRRGLSPDYITGASTVISLAAGALLAIGEFALGGWLIVLGGTLDILDGKVARAMGVSSKAGAFFDSAMDRYADIFVLVGLAAYYRSSWFFLVPLAALMGSFSTSYVRARGLSLGYDCKGGLMQRAERVLLIGLGAILSPIVVVFTEPGVAEPRHYLCAGAAAVLALLSNYTAAFRVVDIYGALGEPGSGAGEGAGAGVTGGDRDPRVDKGSAVP